jgi:hypothetical protein
MQAYDDAELFAVLANLPEYLQAAIDPFGCNGNKPPDGFPIPPPGNGCAFLLQQALAERCSALLLLRSVLVYRDGESNRNDLGQSEETVS